MSHRNTDMRNARDVQRFPLNKPHKSAPPTTTHPVPVMDKYSGPRRAPNSFSTSHQRRAASSRTTPHADRLNTSHISRVTPKGRLRGMDSPIYTPTGLFWALLKDFLCAQSNILSRKVFVKARLLFIGTDFIAHELFSTIIYFKRFHILIKLTFIRLLI
jgi:hypothetical protein